MVSLIIIDAFPLDVVKPRHGDGLQLDSDDHGVIL